VADPIKIKVKHGSNEDDSRIIFPSYVELHAFMEVAACCCCGGMRRTPAALTDAAQPRSDERGGATKQLTDAARTHSLRSLPRCERKEGRPSSCSMRGGRGEGEKGKRSGGRWVNTRLREWLAAV
jgi:hypothetical protein